MRPIKFRGWHAPQKKMFSAEEMAADQLTLLPTGRFINCHSVSTRLSKIYPTDKFIPLQFTGLHDKHGQEIYEGDILRTDNFKGVHRFVVEYETDYCGAPGAFVLRSIEHVPVSSVHCEATEIGEVIGNVFENPELIEQAKGEAEHKGEGA